MVKSLCLLACGVILMSQASGAAHATPAASATVPAEWQKHVLLVDLNDLPKRYSCDALWYRFKDVLAALGAANLDILPYGCAAGAVNPFSPHVQLHFLLPSALSGQDAGTASLRATPRAVLLAPGPQLPHFDAADCALLDQMRQTLLRSLGDPVTGVHLACQQSSTAAAAFGLTVKALVAVREPAISGVASGRRAVAPYGCDFGFRQQGDACAAVPVPAHAYIDELGDGWDCERGYVRQSGRCSPIKLPANAHLTSVDWECNRGFVQEDNRCRKVDIPAHAFALYEPFDTGWDCERGYRKKAQSCIRLQLPEHAYLIPAGDDWMCERGYARRGGSCLQVMVPARAYLTDSGNDWRCERGFHRMQDSCMPVLIPMHAHLDLSGNDWLCNRGFEAQAGQCEAESRASAAAG